MALHTVHMHEKSKTQRVITSIKPFLPRPTVAAFGVIFGLGVLAAGISRAAPKPENLELGCERAQFSVCKYPELPSSLFEHISKQPAKKPASIKVGSTFSFTGSKDGLKTDTMLGIQVQKIVRDPLGGKKSYVTLVLTNLDGATDTVNAAKNSWVEVTTKDGTFFIHLTNAKPGSNGSVKIEVFGTLDPNNATMFAPLGQPLVPRLPVMD
jgi:hypothetical protein